MTKPIRVAPAIEILSLPDSPWIKSAEERADMTLICKDGDNIPRVKEAGKSQVIDGQAVQIMHNGIKVLKGGYQGDWQARVIEGLNGIHEPQEEKVFYETLKLIQPGGTMMELGSWWAYYSMWFLKSVKDSKAYCCEPDPDNLELGKNNVMLNNLQIDKQIYFYQYAAGKDDKQLIDFETIKRGVQQVPIRTVDSIVAQERIDKLDILHLDIQGVELDALKGARQSIETGKIRFVFVSTHHYAISCDPAMHQKCLDYIRSLGGHIIAQHTVLESYSGDGLIVASFDKTDKDFKVTISRQLVENSLFRNSDLDVDILWQSHDDLVNRIIELDKANQELIKANQELQTAISSAQAQLDNVSAFLEEITPLRKHIKRQLKARMHKKPTEQNS